MTSAWPEARDPDTIPTIIQIKAVNKFPDNKISAFIDNFWDWHGGMTLNQLSRQNRVFIAESHSPSFSVKARLVRSKDYLDDVVSHTMTMSDKRWLNFVFFSTQT